MIFKEPNNTVLQKIPVIYKVFWNVNLVTVCPSDNYGILILILMQCDFEWINRKDRFDTFDSMTFKE